MESGNLLCKPRAAKMPSGGEMIETLAPAGKGLRRFLRVFPQTLRVLLVCVLLLATRKPSAAKSAWASEVLGGLGVERRAGV